MKKNVLCRKRNLCRLLFALALAAAAPQCGADEGLWLPDKIPARQLKSRMDFTATPQWAAHWQKASLGASSNLGSAAFVSPEGLVLTNWHVALGYLQAISSAAINYAQNGFTAATRHDEIPLPGLTLYSESWENVTSRVLSAVAGPAAERDINAIMAKVAAEAKDGYYSDAEVVETVPGAEYTLHKSKAFRDVRLVMAPEYRAAFFGGDEANFEYPRYCLDIAFLRAYENNAPVVSPAYFRFSRSGVREGELVFIAGWPAETARRKSLAELRLQKEHVLPDLIARGSRVIGVYEDYYSRDQWERSKDATDKIFTQRNTLKALQGRLNSLNHASTLALKTEEEQKIKRVIARDAELKKVYGNLFTEIETLTRAYAEDYPRYHSGKGWGSGMARNVLLMAEGLSRNKTKANAGYSRSLAKKLFLDPVFDRGLEERLLRSDFEEALRILGPRDEYVKALLAGGDPGETARNLVSSSSYSSAEFRGELLKGGWEAFQKSGDPLIKWATDVLPMLQQDKAREAAQTEELEKLSALHVKAVSEVLGSAFYPDPHSDLILRLSYGKVAGYKDAAKEIPYQTSFAGLFEEADKHGNKPPFDLPDSFVLKRKSINMGTPLNFVSTADMAGGNSGSPVFNRADELVGVAFDLNRQAASGWTHVYSDEKGRSVMVDVRAIVEALRNIYDMGYLVKELTGE